MRNILQSKTGVSCLAAAAALCVAANFVNFPPHRSMMAAARESSSPIEEQREESYQVPPRSRVAVELHNWRELLPLESLRRDPFAAVFAPPPAAVTNVAAPSFQLQAVSLDGGRVLAVINNRVVAEGEFIEGCRVERIFQREVRLLSPVYGPVTATFDRTPIQSRASSPNKSPSANPSTADLRASPAPASPSGTAR
jgi:hypothetical protein